MMQKRDPKHVKLLLRHNIDSNVDYGKKALTEAGAYIDHKMESTMAVSIMALGMAQNATFRFRKTQN